MQGLPYPACSNHNHPVPPAHLGYRIAVPLSDTTVRILLDAGIPVQQDVSLAEHVWWRVGGRADGFARVGTLEQLIAVQRVASAEDLPVFVLGNGSNLLVSDQGVRGLVIVLAGELAECSEPDLETGMLEVGAGFKLTVLVSRSHRQGWMGLEVFAGIPGTLGGAIRMNAGAGLGETVEALVDVDVVHPGGSLETLSVADLRLPNGESLEPGGLNQSPCIISWRIAEGRATARVAQRLGGLAALEKLLDSGAEQLRIARPELETGAGDNGTSG